MPSTANPQTIGDGPKINLHLSPAHGRRLRAMCVHDRRTQQDFLRILIEQEWERRQERAKQLKEEIAKG